jgi:hypothetical protein
VHSEQQLCQVIFAISTKFLGKVGLIRLTRIKDSQKIGPITRQDPFIGYSHFIYGFNAVNTRTKALKFQFSFQLLISQDSKTYSSSVLQTERNVRTSNVKERKIGWDERKSILSLLISDNSEKSRFKVSFERQNGARDSGRKEALKDLALKTPLIKNFVISN